MSSPIRSIKDLLTGIIYIGLGAGAILTAVLSDYRIGTAFKMGPAYFPIVLSSLLVFIGLLSVVRAFLKAGTPVGTFAWKGLALVVAPTIVFAFLVRTAGFVVVLPMLVIASSLASRQFRWGPVLALAGGLTVFCALVFLKGLGVPIPMLGSWFGG